MSYKRQSALVGVRVFVVCMSVDLVFDCNEIYGVIGLSCNILGLCISSVSLCSCLFHLLTSVFGCDGYDKCVSCW